MRVRGELKQYMVYGRHTPSGKMTDPPIYKMNIFAPDRCSAKSRFWYFVKSLKKVKKAHGEILQCKLIGEKKPTQIKNYGIWLRYVSRSGIHNMYREYRELTAAKAVTSSYRDMGARHRARPSSIQIIRVKQVENEKVRRPNIKQFIKPNVRFPLPHRVNHKLYVPRFSTKRPQTKY
ncbi:60S ribosomal protein L18a [Patella vulgata]|uniref:60S ribosomal protein L18a n=1 Tax=Patella vulgata TaxID=6465 RepID=UPI0021807006|nr:60S ribosomal protein L18a [Patella vulgata]